jgi:hypothetical protein
MANTIKGEVGILSLWDATITTPAYLPIACATSHTLDTSTSIIESNTKCDPGVTIKQAGVFSYTISLDGQYLDTTSAGAPDLDTLGSHDYLLALQQTGAVVEFELDTGLADTTYYGDAIISDLSLTQGSGDEISTFSLTLNGSGAIVTTDPNP